MDLIPEATTTARTIEEVGEPFTTIPVRVANLYERLRMLELRRVPLASLRFLWVKLPVVALVPQFVPAVVGVNCNHGTPDY